MGDFKKLEKNIGITFQDEELLRQALTHRSYINEHPEFMLGHNERLEFLGDAVLEIIVTEYLFLNFKEHPEGDLTNWRASLVNAKMLFVVAEDIELEDFVYLSKGEARDKNKKSRTYILANAVEAVIGAIYLDQGLEAAKKFINQFILSHLGEILENRLYLDPKSRFQEIAQEREGVTPHYEILEESGPDHAKTFKVGLFLDSRMVSTGAGSSKQEAQVEAARQGLEELSWQ
jgi:ribonuclease-3